MFFCLLRYYPFLIMELYVCSRPTRMERLELNFLLARVFLEKQQCSCCLGQMFLPAVLCVKGHSVCGICKPTVNTCKICSDKFALRVTMLGVPEYCCCYSKYGCTETYPVHVLRKHLPTCSYRVLELPEVCEGNSTWKGNLRHVKD
jgi:hypothetical protein